MEIRLRDVTISVDDLENRKIGGYINVTNRESEVMYSKKRGMYFKEIMQPGVFKDAIDNNKNIPLLLEHDHGKQLADLRSGTLELREDNIGLRFDAVINDDDVYRNIKDGKINSCSFGFSVLEDSFEPINSKLEKRFVRKIKLDEVSLVENPAYIGSLCETRALEEELREEELAKTLSEERKDSMPKTNDTKKKELTAEDLMKADMQMDMAEDQAELEAKKKLYGNRASSEMDELMKKKAQVEMEEEKMDMAEDEAELQAKKKMLDNMSKRELDADLIRSIVREVVAELRAIAEEEKVSATTPKKEKIEDKDATKKEETKEVDDEETSKNENFLVENDTEEVEEEKVKEEKREIDPRLLKMRVELLNLTN